MTDLKLITTDRPNAIMASECKVTLGKDVLVFNDFFVVGMTEGSDRAAMLFRADCVTLGLAVKFAANAFDKMFEELSAKEKEDVMAAIDAY